nr:ribonuclease H-like domain-containing protein [Tanacetum cinerariifolium]
MTVGDDINKSIIDVNKHDDIASCFELNLSFGDTLYLHHNDTTGSPIVTISPDLFSGAIYAKTAFEMWNDLKKIMTKFDAMISLPPCTSEAAKHFEKHNQLIKLMQFLMDLDESYLAIRSNILTKETLPMVKAAFAIINGEESHRNVTSVGANKPTTTAFATKISDN